MAKKNKKNKNQDVEMNDDVEMFAGEDYSGDSPVPYPQRIENEFIVMMDDDELHNLGRSLFDSISRVSRMNLNPYPWEVELCYVQREMNLRSTRRAAHAEWLSKNPPEEVV
jgi:hypothetical protein